jgi:hypothetical protein
MGIVPKEDLPRMEYLKGSMFIEPKVLQVEGFEKFSPSEPKFGADDKHALVKKGTLKIGELFRYSFKDEFGDIMKFDSHSTRLYYAFTNVNPDKGQSVKIWKEGEGMKTMWFVELVK